MYCAIRPDYGQRCRRSRPHLRPVGEAAAVRSGGGLLRSRGRLHRGAPRVVIDLRRDSRRLTVGQLTERFAEGADVAREVRADARRLDLVALPPATAVGGVVLTEP